MSTRRWLTSLGLGLVVLVVAPSIRSEDRLTVRGAYYREASTRVVQPMLQVQKDLPAGFDVSAYGLVDAITSASIASGTDQDAIFTEVRKEAGVVVGRTMKATHVALAFRQSLEPDYTSHSEGLTVSQSIWGNTGTIDFSFARSDDTVGPNLDLLLRVYFAGLSYTQALSPTTLAQIGYEVAHFDGYQANVYLQVPNLGREKLPGVRLRHTAVARVAHFFPRLRAGVQLHYRFYYDQSPEQPSNRWGINAGNVEGRVYAELGRGFEMRLSYRYYSQTPAAFYCETNPARGGRSDCYGLFPDFYAVDAKFGRMSSHLPEAKLIWEAAPLARIPILAWFAGGAFEISYGYFIQDTHYGNAHLLQTAYSLPF